MIDTDLGVEHSLDVEHCTQRPLDVPLINLAHNANRAPRYFNVRGCWKCPPSEGALVRFARMTSDPTEADVILCNDMNFKITVAKGSVAELTIPDDMLGVLFARECTDRMGADLQGVRSFVFPYSLIINGKIEQTGPVTIDHRCLPDDLDKYGKQVISKLEINTGIYIPSAFKGAQHSSPAPSGQQAFMSNEEETS